MVRIPPRWALSTFVIVATLVIAAVTGGALWQLREEVLHNAEREIQNLNRSVAEMVLRSVQAVDLVMTLTLDYVEVSTDQVVTPSRQMHEPLRAAIAGLPQLQAILVVNAAGIVVSTSRSSTSPLNDVTDRDYFRAQRDAPDRGFYVDRPVRNRYDDSWTLFVSRRISGPRGEFLGIVVAAIEPSYFEKFGETLQPDPSRRMSLFRSDAVLLAASPHADQWIGKTFARPQGAVGPFPEGTSFISRDISPIRGDSRILAISALRGFPFSVVNSIAEEAVLAPWRREAMVLASVGLVAAAALTLFAWLLARQIRWRDLQILATQENSKALAAERAILERIATAAPLTAILEAICRAIEIQIEGGLCSILLMDEDGIHIRNGASPSLPPEFTAAIEGVGIGPQVGSCGTAAFRREEVFVSDVMTDPLWENYRDLAVEHGIGACWSTPIFSVSGVLRGTFAIYFRTTRSATEADRDWIERAVRLTEIAIERSHNEQAMIAAETEAVQANRAKSVFLMNMSHELRTPLNAILGFSEGLEQGYFGPLHDRQRTYVGDIRQAGSHLLDLINELLDLSRIDAGKLEMHDELLDVSAEIDRCVRAVAGTAAAADVTIEAIRGETIPPLYADRTRVRQILINLLSNAAKFTPRGGRVTVNAIQMEDGSLDISIVDDGIGMTAEEIVLALEPFRQINAVLAKRHGGAGLGLPLSKRLIELHGGRLMLRSQAGVGTIAQIIFPPERLVQDFIADAV